MSELLLWFCIPLMLLIFACLVQAAKAPAAVDRLLAISSLGIKIIALLAVIACISETYFLDVTFLCALVNFLITISVARYLEKCKLS